MSGTTLLRRGCLAVILLTIGLGLVLAFGWWRARSAPELWEQQRALLETRTEPERRELSERVEERLRRAAREVAPPPAPASTSGAPRQVNGGAAPSPDPDPEAPRAGAAERSGRDKPRKGSPPRAKAPPSSEKDEIRQVTLHMDELNALLQERVARWEAQRRGSPLPIRNPILAIEDDHLVLFIQLLNRGSEMLLALPVDIAIDDRGGVARLLGVRLGQLPLPGLEALPRLLRSTGDPGLAELAVEAETAASGYPFDPVLEIDAGLPLRVVGLEVDGEAQALHLTIGSG